MIMKKEYSAFAFIVLFHSLLLSTCFIPACQIAKEQTENGDSTQVDTLRPDTVEAIKDTIKLK